MRSEQIEDFSSVHCPSQDNEWTLLTLRLGGKIGWWYNSTILLMWDRLTERHDYG